MFCIDASESMHKIHDSKKKRYQKSNLHMALECAAELQKRLVLFNPSTSVGVLLYNTVWLKLEIVTRSTLTGS